MSNDRRKIERKANTPTVEDDDTRTDGGGQDVRPDLEHFDGFDRDTLRSRIPSFARPDVSIVGVAMAVLYASVAFGALSVAYGSTALAAAHGGVYVALIVAGAFAFAYAYIGLRVVDAVTNEPQTEPYE